MLTQIKEIEFKALLNNQKPVIRHGYYENELSQIEDFCKKNNIFIVRSQFKVKLQGKKFSDKGLKTNLDDPKGLFFVYMSKDELKAYQAALFELKQDHQKLGQLLGYPKCCINFFTEQFPIRSKLDNNYEISVLENSPNKEYPFYANIFQRQNDFCLLSHFPCNLGCRDSIEIGKKHFDLLNKKNKRLFKENLSKPIAIDDRKITFN